MQTPDRLGSHPISLFSCNFWHIPQPLQPCFPIYGTEIIVALSHRAVVSIKWFTACLSFRSGSGPQEEPTLVSLRCQPHNLWVAVWTLQWGSWRGRDVPRPPSPSPGPGLAFLPLPWAPKRDPPVRCVWASSSQRTQRKVWGPTLTGGKMRLREIKHFPQVTQLASQHQIPTLFLTAEIFQLTWMREIDCGAPPSGHLTPRSHSGPVSDPFSLPRISSFTMLLPGAHHEEKQADLCLNSGPTACHLRKSLSLCELPFLNCERLD